MEFADPAFLLLGFLLIPAFLVAVGRRRPATVVPALGGISVPRPGLRVWLARLLPVARVIALLLIVVGLARPRSAEAETTLPVEGIDIVLTVDISSSMVSTRFGESSSRLEATRDVLRDFVATRENDRVGLVAFQRDAIVLAPLTSDYDALAAIVRDLDSGLLPDGTGIGSGIATGVNLLRDSTATSRVVVLLTDGQHNARSLPPEEAASLAEALGVRLYTVGVVRSAASSEIDAPRLRAIAEQTGGQHFNAADARELAGIYDEIGALEASRLPGDLFERFTEHGTWFILSGSLLLAAELLLAGTWLRRLPA